MSKTTRRITWGAVLVLLISAGVWARRHAANDKTPPEMQYEHVKADLGPVVAKVSASGTLSALVTVQVGAQVSGRVQEITVDYNSPVHAGEVIAKLDPVLFQAAVDQSKANLATAQSGVKTAEAQAKNADLQYERSKSLLARALLDQSDFDTSEANDEVTKAQLDSAKSNLAVAQAALHQAEVNLGYATITSPIDGTVISRSVDVGQTVAAAFQAPTLFLIAKDLREMQVDTSVSEADVGRLTTGMPASFSVDAYPGEIFNGSVRQIRSSPTTVQNVVTYDAVIDVNNASLKLKPGMTANVSFVVAQKDNVTRVPNAALRFQPDPALLQQLGVTPPKAPATMSTKYVWRLQNNVPVPELVDIGITDGTETAIARGNVHDGDDLITDMALAPRRRFGLF